MTFQHKTTDELVRIAMAGGGFKLETQYKTADELARIALAAAKGQARVVFVGITRAKTTDDIVRIAMAGKGMVFFEE